jgi:hypothetical protein
MKVVGNPTIELEEKDIKVIKEIYETIKNMPCSSLHCNKCPFATICDYVDMNVADGASATVLNIQKALNEALIE